MIMPDLPRPEYPRPQFVRPDWLCLNGVWQFEIDAGDSGKERGLLDRPLDREINVPFCPESTLSGIGHVDFMRVVWYRREIEVPAAWEGKRVLLLGMNPGPWGMAQTGVPFGEVAAVRDWLGLRGKIGSPPDPHPKRPIEGLSCGRSEVSGRRLWGLMRERFGAPEDFAREHFILNYCPLVFMEVGGRNRTPDKLPADERAGLDAACDQHLRDALTILRPEFVVGVGRFAERKATAAVQHLPVDSAAPNVATILHPSPASPAANRDWAGRATAQLIAAGIWSASA